MSTSAKPKKPHYLPVKYENIPPALRSYPNFVGWRADWREEDEGWAKVPYCAATERQASVINPSTWGPFDAVAEFCQNREMDGIGFVLTIEAGIVALDYDHVVEDGRVIDAQALEEITLIDSYTELSPSGRGVRVLARGKIPMRGRRRDNFEIYASHRYVTLTGSRL